MKRKIENRTLYFDNVDFNNALIINALSRIILKSGGYVKKPDFYTYTLYRRHALERADETKSRITRMETLTDRNEKQNEYLNELKKDYEKAVKFSTPINCKYSNYLTFIYNGFHYYVQLDSNPFFDSYYIKQPVIGNGATLKRDRFLTVMDFLNKCQRAANFDIFDMYNTARKAYYVARNIFNELTAAPVSEQYKDNRQGEKIDLSNYEHKAEYETNYYIKGIYGVECCADDAADAERLLKDYRENVDYCVWIEKKRELKTI